MVFRIFNVLRLIICYFSMGDTLQRTVNEIDLQLYERYGRLHLFGAIKKLPPSSFLFSTQTEELKI